MRQKTVKISTRITPGQNAALVEAASWGGFKSTYQLLQYLVFCFLRASRQGIDPVQRDLPPEIVKIFIDGRDADARLISQAISNINRRKAWRDAQRRHRAPKSDGISSEVADLFAECEREGAERSWGPDINKRM